MYSFFILAQQPLVGQGRLIVEASRSHSDSSGRVISPMRSPLPDNTQHSQRHPRRRGDSNPHSQQSVAADPRLRKRGHWGRLRVKLIYTAPLKGNIYTIWTEINVFSPLSNTNICLRRKKNRNVYRSKQHKTSVTGSVGNKWSEKIHKHFY